MALDLTGEVQQSIDRLTQAWIGEGRALPLLYPLEVVEVVHFGERHGVGSAQMLEVMRVLAEHAERLCADVDAFGEVRFS